MATLLTRASVIGPVETPTGDKPVHGRIRFLLPRADGEGVTVVAPATQEFALDAEGEFTAQLWCPATGALGLSYTVQLVRWDPVANTQVTEHLGYMSLAFSVSPQRLADLLTDTVPAPTPTDLLAAINAAATSTATNAAAAAASVVAAQAQAAILAGVLAFGALGNGTTNDQTAFNNALAATSGAVYVPATTSTYPVTSLTADEIGRLWGPGAVRAGSAALFINSIPPSADPTVAPLRVIQNNLQPVQWSTINGAVHDGVATFIATRTGGFALYGLHSIDYQTSGIPTPALQFDVASTAWFSSGGLDGGSGFVGWDAINSPSAAFGHVWTSGSIVGREINFGNRWALGALKADLTGVRDIVGLKLVPDVGPSRQGATAAILPADFALAIGASIHGHKVWTGTLVGIDAIYPGGVAHKVRGASTLGNAPSHLWLSDGFYTNGAVFGGTFTDGLVISGTGTRGINLSAATLSGSAIRLATDHQISWGGSVIYGGATGLSISLGNNTGLSLTNDFHLYTANFARRALRAGDTGTESAIGFLGAAPATRVALPVAATDDATTQALANAMRGLLITFGFAA